MRLLNFIKLTSFFIISLISTQALAHTDAALGEGVIHHLYHGVFVLAALLALANGISCWWDKSKNQ